MKLALKLGLSMAIAGVLALPSALAQPRKGPGPGMPRYDKSTETTISGVVNEVQQMQRGRMGGTHLIVKTDAETLEVHLGPSSFLSSQGFSFTKGDTVEVLGSRVKFGDTEALIAREVTKDGKKLTLRDDSGRPMWAGRRP